MIAAIGQRPQAVLFDFGGVIADIVHDDTGFTAVANEVARHIGGALPVIDVEADLRAGARAYESWKQSQSRRIHPREITYTEFWELVCCDWPEAPRRALLEDAATAARLCECFETATLHRPAKPDSRDLLLALRALGISTALVSNCLAAEAARRQLRADRLTGLFDTEIYSDEVGIRKPDPEIMLTAVRAVGADPAATWFVGDKYNRDILGARRAGLGAAVLMSSPGGPGTPVRGIEADAEIASPMELLALFQ